MAKQLGPTFGEEVLAAGLGGLPFSWGATSDDIFGRENLTSEQNATLDGVIEVFYSRICVDGRDYRLGTFATAAEAHATYVDALRRAHGKFVPTEMRGD
jgi:hypothetical protein